VDHNRNETDPRYSLLFSFLKVIDVMGILMLIETEERTQAMFALFQIKKLLDEEKHDAITRRSLERAVPHYVAPE
jgi:hypothetical protein